jgi:hypothetical protein
MAFAAINGDHGAATFDAPRGTMWRGGHDAG